MKMANITAAIVAQGVELALLSSKQLALRLVTMAARDGG